MRMSRKQVLEEFERNRYLHDGDVVKAARLLDMSPAALDRALYRAKKDGIEITFKPYSRPRRTPISDSFAVEVNEEGMTGIRISL